MLTAQVRDGAWWRSLLRRHWLVIALVVAGLAVRALAFVTYRTGLFFYADSWGYLQAAQQFSAHAQHPFGYPAFLRLMSWTGHLPAVLLVQHLAGVGIGVTVYVVLYRRGLPRTLAAVFAAPLLLDAYLIDLEQQIMSETLFTVLLLSAVLIVMRRRVDAWSAALAGALLCATTLTRNVVLPMAVLFVAYLLLRRVGWRAIGAFAVAFVVPILLYGAWIPPSAGSFATSASGGQILYGRVATFADCRVVHLTADEERMCPSGVPALRPDGNFYSWSKNSPFFQAPGSHTAQAKLGSKFAVKVIEAQPVPYAKQITHDVVHYFEPGHTIGRHDSSIGPWTFPIRATTTHYQLGLSIGAVDFAGNPVTRVTHPREARILRAYQRVFYTPGPLMLLLLVLGFAGAIVGRGRRERLDAPFAALLGLGLLVVPAATAIFDYRYELLAIPMFCLAGGLGLAALLARRSVASPPTDEVVEAGDDTPDREPGPPGGGRIGAIPAPAVVLGVIAVVGALIVLAPLHRNPIFDAYGNVRFEFGAYGLPVGAPFSIPGEPDSRVQRYEHGLITSESGRVRNVGPTVTAAIRAHGGIKQFGTAATYYKPWASDPSQRFQSFTNGAVFVGHGTTPRVVLGPIFAAWSLPAHQAVLGAPLDDARTASDGTMTQIFQGGRIVVQGGSVRVEPLKTLLRGSDLAPTRDA